jgi:flagellar basal-body rod protein FlgG
MERALWSAVTGMKAQELCLDTIANNMANINTTGFKKSQISFQDMLYSTLSSPGAESGEGSLPTGIQVGHGTRVAGIAKQFSQGSLVETGKNLDVAVEGDGFFEVILPDGTSAYTRDGSFRQSATGEVVTTNGYKVTAFGTIDPGTTEINIAADGAFSTVVNGTLTNKSAITLARFANPEGLRSIGRNLYVATDASGTAQTGVVPGTNGIGTLAQRHVESSNVNAAEELVAMITTQRAYEATSKAIKASDQMLGIANSLRQ